VKRPPKGLAIARKNAIESVTQTLQLLVIAERSGAGISRRGIFWKQKLLQYDCVKIYPSGSIAGETSPLHSSGLEGALE
jgi:hypothetical protein